MRTKRLFVPFSLYEQQAMETFLKKQAAAGWLLTGMGSWFWSFRQIEPQPLQFAILYCSSADEYAPLPTEAQQDREDMCAQSGWHPAARRHDMQVFYTADADALPLETDPVIRVESLRKAMGRLTIRPRMVTIAICLIWLLQYGMRFWSDPIRFLSDGIDALVLPVWCLLLIACLIEPIACVVWHHRARRAARESGRFLPPHIPAHASWVLVVLALCLLCLAIFGSGLPPQWYFAWMILCVAAIVTATLLKNRLQQEDYPAGLNKAITSFAALAVYAVGVVILFAVFIAADMGQMPHVVTGSYGQNGRTYDIYNDFLPLTAEDLTETDAVYSRKATTYASPLLRRTLYEQSPLVPQYAGAPTLWYTVYDTDFAFVQDLVVRQLLDEHQDEVYEDGSVLQDSYFAIDPAPYGAQAAYQLQWSSAGSIPQYLLCWPGRVVELRFAYLEPTEEQLARAASLLAPSA